MKRMTSWFLAALLVCMVAGCSGPGAKKLEVNSPEGAGKTLRASGYSHYDDSGKASVNQRWLMAQQAARLDAYRGLADQLYKEILDGQKTVGEQVMSDDVYRVYMDTYMRGARAADYRTVKDTLKATLELTVTPRFYRCMSGDTAVVSQCLQEDNKLPFTRTGSKPATMASVNMACGNRDCSDQLSVQGFSKERNPVDSTLLDAGLYDTEWMLQTGVNLFLIHGVVFGF